MTTVKNLHYITDLLSGEKLKKLEYGASLYKRHGRIKFKIKSAGEDKLVIRTTQSKSPAENYSDKKTLIQRTRELFGRFLPDKKIIVHATAYQPPPTDEVTPKWISNHMAEEKISIKDLVSLTGIDRTNFSAWINGKRPMSQPVKAMFYYFFKTKKKAT
jgi:hypothetical protein